MKTRLYTKEQVIQAVEEALRDLDTTSAPEKGQIDKYFQVVQMNNQSSVASRGAFFLPFRR